MNPTGLTAEEKIIYIVVEDAASNMSNVLSVTIPAYIADEAPTINSANSTTFTVGTAGSFTVTASNMPNSFAVSGDTLPTGVAFDTITGVLSGTPAAGMAGTYSLSFTATNGSGTSTAQNFTLTVNPAGVAPTITSANSTAFTVGTAGSFTVTASNSPTSFAVSGTLPTGVTFDTTTGVLSGTPAAGTAGTYNLSFTATNSSGPSTAQSFTLTVSPADVAPTITSANSTTFTVGTAGSFTVTASNMPNSFAVSGDTLPTGVAFDTTTGVLSGTPAAGTAGTYSLSFTATNVSGPSTAQSFTLTVNPAGGDIIINAANFPDANFRAWLTNGANIGGAGSDNLLTAAEIAAITSMNVSNQNISNLTGIGYFTALTTLRCYTNNLTELPDLPDSLTWLDYSNNSLTELPALPDSLTALECSYNSLTELPALPNGLTYLDCSNNSLTALPDLPDSLIELWCYENSLTALPDLPTGLGILHCSNTNLTALPTLPDSLTYLNCSYNSLTALVLNDSATYTNIDVSFNNLASEAAVTGNSITWNGSDFKFAPQRTPITFTATQTGGTSGTADSTGITLTFSEAVAWLTAEKITITNGTGSAVKGALSGSDTTWTIALSSVTTQGDVTVSVADFWRFHATPASLTVAVYKASGGGGGGGGGGGSSVVTPPAEQPKTETTTSGNTATATTTVTAAVNSSGTATATVTQAQISDAITKAAEAAAKQGGGTAAVVEIKVTAPAEAKTVETSIPKAAMELIADGKTAALTVSTPVASLRFDAAALSTIAGKAAGDVNISASIVDASTLSAATQQLIGDRPVFNFSVTGGGQTISQFGGSVSVSVPYTPKAGEDLNAIVIYYINAEGKPEVVSNGSYDPATGTISFKTNHFSQYAVGYNKVTFQDVAESAWYSKAVGFIAARGVTTGTGNGNYSPDAKLTRGEFIVMMMKAYGIAPDTVTADNFADAGNTYYTGYLAAAKRLGISGGVGGNLFAPGKEITRQEMFTLLYNALKAIGELPEGNTGKSLSAFSDAGQVASWAKDAMTLLVKTGTVSGTNGKLTPEETTTRAQMAQVLYNLLSQ